MSVCPYVCLMYFCGHEQTKKQVFNFFVVCLFVLFYFVSFSNPIISVASRSLYLYSELCRSSCFFASCSSVLHKKQQRQQAGFVSHRAHLMRTLWVQCDGGIFSKVTQRILVCGYILLATSALLYLEMLLPQDRPWTCLTVAKSR